MRKLYISLAIILFLSTVFSFVLFKTSINEYTQNELMSNSYNKWGEGFECNETSGPDEWAKQQYLMTRDPRTGEVPDHLAFEEYERIRNLKMVDPLDIIWEERGPLNVGGRTRAIMWDPNDPIHRKFWAGGVSGGLWYTDNIENPSIAWHKVDDFWDNLAISCIAYDPGFKQIFYVGTGERWAGIPGKGIWKSTDAGATWNRLMSTANNDDFEYVQKIVVSLNGDVYAATERNGVMRSTNFGFSWNAVLNRTTLDTSFSNRAADLEITDDNFILAAMGFYGSSDGVYISPSGDEGTWTRLNDGNNGFPTAADGINRIELAVAPSNSSVIYALVENDSTINRPTVVDSDIKGIYKTTNKGESWVPLTIPILTINEDGDTIFFSATQTDYDLVAAVHPTDPNTLFVGGVSLHRSTDGGDTWKKIDGIHEDHHAMAFSPEDPQTLVFGNDGGVYMTENCTQSQDPTIIDRNQGYRVTQFHACALHPVGGENYFLGGTQDNGSHQFTHYGMNMTNQVIGADGGYCYIFKNNPAYQIVSTQKNVFFLSRDNGDNFNERIYHNSNSGFGLISPWDYDENNDVMYASYAPHSILIIKNVTSNVLRTASYQYYNGLFPNWTTAFKVSPFSERTLFVGTEKGKLIKITNASSLLDYDTTVISDPGFQDNFINCIELGANEDQILVILSNYGIPSVWETLDGGISWKDKEGDLSDFPIYWGIYNPLDFRQVLLATELGVYTTEDITAGSVHWAPANNGMANVRTTMLKVRESDHLVIASTYGRGIFSTNSLSVSPSTKIVASDGQAEDHFGDAVATNGDFAMVGAPDADERGTDAGAVYVYEPINNQWTESAKLLAPDGADGDNFGGGVDMFGDLAIIGAQFDDPGGSAYIYRLSGNSWNLESKITPNDGGINDNFGKSVAIFDDVAAVGAYSAGDFGAVYIFNYQGGNWVQVQKIIPEDGEINDWFGHSVDLDGNYLIIGNPDDNDNGTISGSAYIYNYDSGWTLDKKIIGDDVDEADRFGWSVAIDGQYAVVGAKEDEGVNGTPHAGAAYVFLNSISSNWEQRAKLLALDAEGMQWFGYSVSIFGDYILIGATNDSEVDTWSGAAYVFKKEGSSENWLRQNKLFAEDGDQLDLFGTSVHLYGTSAVVSSVWDDDNGYNSGSAYIFKSIVNSNNLPLLSVTPSSFDVTSEQTTVAVQINNNGPPGGAVMNWTAYSLDPWLQIVGDSSGSNSGTVTVTVEENLYCARDGRIIVRASGALHSPREVFIKQEAGPGPNEVKIIANDPNGSDYFGYSVDVGGDYAIVGATEDDEFGSNAGAAYIFERDGCCSWIQKAKLRLNSPTNGDYLGTSVAISGNVAIVGTGTRSKVFVFEKPIGGWQDTTETAVLVPSDGAPNQYFGHSIDISGENVIVGAPGSKKIFIYERPEGGWQDMSETYSYHSPSSSYNSFGVSVAIDNNYAVVGCKKIDVLTSPGKVYVFKQDWVWGLEAELVPSDSQNEDYFGSSVDIDANRIIVGAENTEAAYIFARDKNGLWYESQKLTGGTAFGFAMGPECVSIDGDYALVGARQSSDSSNIRTGSVFSFIRKETGWLFSKQIFSSEHEQIAEFGGAVSISGPFTIISADHSTLNNVWYTGAAYIYCTKGDIVTSVSDPQEEQTLPISYDLKQNYPNPFNPVTTIVFDLPKPTNVTLKIYTILGEEVTTIVSEELKAGTHKYMWNPASLASGIYLYRIESKEFTVTKKMVYLK